MNDDQLILKHYKKVADNFGLKSRSAMEDPFVREIEIDFILKEIDLYKKSNKQELKILELGSGNGHLLSVLRSRYAKDHLFGIEFSPELCKLATSRDLPHVKIINSDCRSYFLLLFIT